MNAKKVVEHVVAWGLQPLRRLAVLLVAGSAIAGCGTDESGGDDVSGNWSLTVQASSSCSGRLPSAFMSRTWQVSIIQIENACQMSVVASSGGGSGGCFVNKGAFTIQSLVVVEFVSGSVSAYSLGPPLQGQGTISGSTISGTLSGGIIGTQACTATDHRFTMRR